ncbi:MULTISPECIES: putative metalloprotease CJM1_0395 family protein [unclassified Campylobacter]|uniref:putative metalloprotease CJM1_0395 family protein n=1 Tax=unclassified Campylobacter TaxID=2593542 RepID=UPI001237B681|nr:MULTISPECIES: putative metalloprotease CJM1_0395 family protein [unclassified Campylobacter]KAA6224930.1 hypothetical protein FMM57_08125 [Campylobacter sp. LR286c]KAA6228405.1 hypothetical protein FMM54_00685 [Campylobacter sp. LR185c]KAA6228891.1 hypothetical protein FMM55_00225 [Campylobacter sp. LR196d]KAA6229845.1 hypothetical protein FMM56_07375 [Campylobacter sp. LR264d]KAA6234056.1 hypothetical protein FMM58_00785 [Campylobacter sp. LR291e]
MQINSNLYNTFSFYNSQNLEDTNSTNQEDTTQINGVELNDSELRQVKELQQIDREVRAHEAAHQAAGGGLTGSANYSYEKGPDNQMYAVAGEVPISMKKGGTPEQTIVNARKIYAAAMAPADPSPQDYRVANDALKMESEARVQKNEEQKAELEEKKDTQNSNEEEGFEVDTPEKINTSTTSSYTISNLAKNNYVFSAYTQNKEIGSNLNIAS